MSGYKVPLSSSPAAPLTPGSGQGRDNNLNSSNFYASNASSTPAGPPPSSAKSFTPAYPPPSSIFGSSQLGSGKTLFKSRSSHSSGSNPQRHSSPSTKVIDPSKLERYLNNTNRFSMSNLDSTAANSGFNVLSSSPPQEYPSEEEQWEDEVSEDVSEQEEVGKELSVLLEPSTKASNRPTGSSRFVPASTSQSSIPNGSLASKTSIDRGASILGATPRGVKRSRGGAMIPYASSRSVKTLPLPKRDSAIPSIAKNMATQLGAATIAESDDMILKAEDLMEALCATEAEGFDNAVEAALPSTSESLCNLWKACCEEDLAKIQPDADTIVGIGPSNGAPTIHKAVFLGSLLLQLHHPSTAKGKQALAVLQFGRPSTFGKFSLSSQATANPTAMPKVLMDWLNSNHDPYRFTIAEVQTYHPNPTAHLNFWDILLSAISRGRVTDVVRLFKRSNFQHATTARDDGQVDGIYHSVQVKNVERVINRAIQVLELCPILQDGDWHITGNEWMIFRKRIEQAVDDLATFAEGRDRDLDPAESTFEASNFGLWSTSMGFSQSTRRAESRVPWTIYQNLKAMYGILLGGTTEILAHSQDWVEAVVGLSVWWNGEEDDEIAVGNLALTRRSLRQSQSRATRLVDVNPNAAYLRRLADIFARVTDDSDSELFQINSANPIEVGLASIFEGNVKGVMGLLRGWSLPVTSAIAEIASLGGWFDSPATSGVMNGFDESDLMVFSSYDQPEQSFSKDTIMIEYADGLFDKEELRAERKSTVREGWELSMSLLARLGDDSISIPKIGELLERLSLDSTERVEKILRVCGDCGLTKEARSITERYADSVAQNTDSYGTALIYYARAHRPEKLKSILDLLTSLSLVQSLAFPPSSALDRTVHSLLYDPKQSLRHLAEKDPEAADILHTYLTGYATLRKFYDLRDEEVNLQEGQKPTLRPIARKKAAASALLAVINSAAESIHGGLFDEEQSSIIQVDGLLALLGEAMVFVNQARPILTPAQSLLILRCIEDLQAVHTSLYNKCEESFRSTLAAYYGHAKPSSPRQLLKKQLSTGTSTSSFSLVGSSMLDSQTLSEGSGVHVDGGKRGWDWRIGMGEEAKGQDVLRVLRLGLAKDVARGWTEGEAV